MSEALEIITEEMIDKLGKRLRGDVETIKDISRVCEDRVYAEQEAREIRMKLTEIYSDGFMPAKLRIKALGYVPMNLLKRFWWGLVIDLDNEF